MLNQPPSNSVSLQIEHLLTEATAKISQARVRNALAKAAESAAVALAATGAIVLFGRWVIAPRSVSTVLEIAGLLTAIGILATAGVRESIHHKDSADVAERLDLPANNANAIATALDLARSDDISPFALNAIDQGLIAAHSLQFAEPMVDSPPVKSARIVTLLLLGVAMMVVGHGITPAAPRLNSTADYLPIHNVSASSLGVAELKSPALPINPVPTREPHQSNLSPGAGTPSATSHHGTDRSTSQTSSAEAAQTSAQMQSGAASSADQNTPPAESHTSPINPAHASSSKDAASPTLEASAGSPPGAGGFDANADLTSSNAKDPNSPASQTGDKSGSEAESSSHDKPAGGSKKSGAAGAPSSPDGKESKAGKKNGGAGASSSENGMNGNGKQPGGGNAPKKSRGVAPLMLGTHEPDLLTGKKLTGADERTDLQVPPQPNPESPAAAAAENANPRTGDESAVSPYIVPAEMRDAVADYFRKFHSDDQAK